MWSYYQAGCFCDVAAFARQPFVETAGLTFLRLTKLSRTRDVGQR